MSNQEHNSVKNISRSFTKPKSKLSENSNYENNSSIKQTRSAPIPDTRKNEEIEDDDIKLLATIKASEKKFQTKCEPCSHEQTINENGIDICIDCGIALYDKLTHEAEWRYYGENDNQHSFDPSRVQYRKVVDKGVKKDLEKIDLPQQVIELADILYSKVTHGDIKRSKLRKGIIFACVLYAYNQLGNPKTSQELQKIFNGNVDVDENDNDETYIKKKNISKGIIYFKKRMPKEETINHYITAEHYIPEVLEKFNIKAEHASNIIELYKNLKNKSSVINRRNPKSVSCGIVFYYLKRLNLDITASKFGKLVNLSEITINNITSEIEDIIYS